MTMKHADLVRCIVDCFAPVGRGVEEAGCEAFPVRADVGFCRLLRQTA
jgi:hypothetical protein